MDIKKANYCHDMAAKYPQLLVHSTGGGCEEILLSLRWGGWLSMGPTATGALPQTSCETDTSLAWYPDCDEGPGADGPERTVTLAVGLSAADVITAMLLVDAAGKVPSGEPADEDREPRYAENIACADSGIEIVAAGGGYEQIRLELPNARGAIHLASDMGLPSGPGIDAAMSLQLYPGWGDGGCEDYVDLIAGGRVSDAVAFLQIIAQARRA